MIITLARESLLDRGNGGVSGLIGVTVLVVVLFAVVVIRIVSVRITGGAVTISVSVIIVQPQLEISINLVLPAAVSGMPQYVLSF